jgi:hypothetical protein
MDNANQMEFLFEEGGIADDGMNRDPISGNEVPSGSLAQEVRDDIPAQLSEGEYVVPADVVRYYGVKFFEDLRSDAKMGLNKMEQDGRIGGDPVDMEGDDVELTPEEEAELQAIMGVAEGGVITNTYDRLPPQAVGNTGQEQQLAEMDQQMRRAFEEGGDVPAVTQLSPDFSQFRPGFSFMGSGEYAPPVIEPSRNVTLYGPNGEVENLILPSQQARYDELKSQGYSETPTATAPTQPVAEQQDSGSDNEGFDVVRSEKNVNRSLTGAFDFSTGDIDGIMEDPLAWGASQLQPISGLQKGLGAVVSLASPLGPVFGAMSVANQVSNIAKARAAIQYARANNINADNLEAQLQAFLDNSSIAVRAAAGAEAMKAEGVGTGNNYFDQITAAVNAARIRQQTTSANLLELNNKNRAAVYAAIRDPSAQYDPGISSLLDSISSGRTGSGWDNTAVGQISGMDGNAAGVVAYDADYTPNGPEDYRYGLNMKAARVDSRTLHRNEQGQLFVRTGFLGGGIQLLDGDYVTLDNGLRVTNNTTDPALINAHIPGNTSTGAAPAPAAQPAAPAPAPAAPAPQPQSQPQSSGSDDDSGGGNSYSFSYSPPSQQEARASVSQQQSRSGGRGGGMSGGANLDTAYSISGLKDGGFVSRRKKK